jgi:hypothetical protein
MPIPLDAVPRAWRSRRLLSCFFLLPSRFSHLAAAEACLHAVLHLAPTHVHSVLIVHLVCVHHFCSLVSRSLFPVV